MLLMRVPLSRTGWFTGVHSFRLRFMKNQALAPVEYA